MTLSVLKPGDDGWIKAIDNLPPSLRDIHFLPSYGRIYEDVYGHTARLAVWTGDAGSIVQPFILRPLDQIEFIASAGLKGLYDFTHPYGYGGALANRSAAWAEYPAFARAFSEYARDNLFITEFCNIHPLLDSAQRPMVETVHALQTLKMIFSVDLTVDDLLSGFSQGHRRNYRKAASAGVTVRKMNVTAESLSAFQKIYIDTMERHGAARRWFFPDDYFPACHRHLGDGGASLFFAYHEGRLASACFLIHAFDTAYYHFGGSFEEFHDVRASNMLMTEAMIWAKSAGYRQFHLGGGVGSSPDDPLAQFKKGFGAKGYALYSYQAVHHQAMYDRLSALKAEDEARSAVIIENKDYFPLYRR